ncbi:MAG: nuclear transport factor 2 family protein [Flavobacteriaceae bacterium CG_4_10_14_0_8_um_filter_34_31]|nr:MAG: nuclear transport factor 2 family protein [Flavobacteriaceae bacterium CG_4_10_14_0_8_um_filter_34_31]
MNKLLLLLFACSLFTVQTILSQQTQDSIILTQILHNFLEGASNNDRDTHELFWAEDLIYTSSAGTRFGKAEILAGFENETEVLNTPKTNFNADEILINTYGNMAIVAFKMKSQTGDAIQYYYNSGTFLKRNGIWQVVNWQATKIPNQ